MTAVLGAKLTAHCSLVLLRLLVSDLKAACCIGGPQLLWFAAEMLHAAGPGSQVG